MNRTSALDVEALLAKARLTSEQSMRLHPYYRGKIQIAPKCIAGKPMDADALYREASSIVRAAREMTRALMKDGLIVGPTDARKGSSS